MTKKDSLKKQYLHYIAFFGIYFLVLYFFLYHSNDLSPFQHNFHFFSNVIGSLSKRFLADTMPYAFLFILIYFTKRNWLRLVYLAFFYALLWLNVSNILYYYLLRANAQFYVLEGFTLPVFFSFFSPTITVFFLFFVVSNVYWAIFLMKTRKQKVAVSKKKRLIAVTLLPLIFMQTYIIPSYYDLHDTVMAGDKLQKKTFRVTELEKSGTQLLLADLAFHLIPPTVEEKTLSEEDLDFIASLQLEDQRTQEFANPPSKIVLVVAESLNSSFISHYNSQIPEITPTIDSLIEDYSDVPEFYPSGPFTIHGLHAMLCGHTNLDYGRKYIQHECVPRLLKEAGYKTEFIRGTSKYYISENVTFDKFGFEELIAKEDLDLLYPDFKDTHPGHYNTWGYTDNFLFDEAISKLRTEDKIFLTLLGVDMHMPGGRCFESTRDPNELEPILYSVSCFDKYVEDFLAKLEQEGLFDEDLLVLITSDQLYPAFTGIPGDSFSISFKFKPAKIPLLMISKAPFVFAAPQGSQIDIASSLLDLTNIEIPDYYMGKSLLSNSEAIPMGQDRADAFVIVNDVFHQLSTSNSPEEILGTADLTGFHVTLRTRSMDELEALIELNRNAMDRPLYSNAALYKWYYNKYFVHEIE